MWQGYVDEMLIKTGKIQRAAIIGHNGNTFATSATMVLKAGEGYAIANLFKDPQTVFATGVTAGGYKYAGVKSDERSIYGKLGASGIVLAKTGQTIIIASYWETTDPGEAAAVVEKLAGYLLENGY